jgi:hypothetical protein
MTLKNILIYGSLLAVIVSVNEIATGYDLQALTLLPLLFFGYWVVNKYAPKE